MNKNFSKAVSIILSITMLLGMCMLNTGIVEAAKKEVKTVNGYLEVEAEDLPYDESVYSEVSDKMFSGKRGLAPTNEDKTQPKKEDPAQLDASFIADKPGVYYIWLRHTAETENTSGQNLFLSLGGGEYNVTFLTATPTVPKWVKLGEVSVANAGDKGLVKIIRRQYYQIVMDKFIITDDPSFVPDDATLGLPVITPPPTPTPVPLTKVATFTANTDNTAKFEAEKTTVFGVFEKVDDSDASGKKVLRSEVVTTVTPPLGSQPEMAFRVKTGKAGKYVLWMRIKPTTVNKSLYIAVNDGKYNFAAIGGTADEYGWFKASTVTTKADGEEILYKITTATGYLDIDNIIVTSKKGNPMGVEGEIKAGGLALDQTLYPAPSFKPTEAHPRILFNKNDIETIKGNLTKPQNAAAYKRFNALLAQAPDCKLDATAGVNHSASKLETVEAYAFAYAVGMGESYGKTAVSAMKDYLETVNLGSTGTITYNVDAGQVIYSASQVYDWCYDLLSQDDRFLFIDYMETMAEGMTIGYPPTKQGSLVGWGCEGQLLADLNAMAIATYNERPDIYNVVAGRFFSEYVPAREFFYASHLYHQGPGYTDYRFKSDVIALYLYDAAGLPNVFGDDMQYVPYWQVYARRPDGQILRSGDCGNDRTPVGTYATGSARNEMNLANYYSDPYLKQSALLSNPSMGALGPAPEGMSSVELLIFNNPDLQGKPLSELGNTKYFASPIGEMIARTGWSEGFNSPDVVAEMKIGEYYFANHQHLDAGHFQIYYKGILAKDSGYYQAEINTTGEGGTGYGSAHDYHYHKRSVAHNTILVHDPEETMSYYGSVSNDGGQRIIRDGGEPLTLDELKKDYKTGEVLGHEFGPDLLKPEYTYLKGDLTDAYSDKITDFERSFMFFDLDDAAHPAAMIVFDRVVSSNAEFKKSWLLHGMYEPEISGNRTTFVNDKNGYNGKMVVDTLLPEASNTAIEKIGGEGKEFMTGGINYNAVPKTGGSNEGGGWRIEVSPKTPATEDYFLNVLQVGDADSSAAPLNPQKIMADKVIGVQISDRVVTFAKTKNRIEDNISFTFTGDGKFKITVCDAKAGTWKVARNGSVIGSFAASEEGGVISFEGEAGSYSLSYEKADSNKAFTQSQPAYDENIHIRVNGTFIYSDVPPTIKNDRTLVPMRAIFEALGADVTWDEATATATAAKDGRTVKVTENNKTAYINDDANELDVPAQIINGRFVVPVRFVSEAFGAKVTWYELAQLVDIKPGSFIDVPKEGYAKIVASSASGYNGEEVVENSYDNDPNTLWSAEGEHWLNYEFDQEYTISGIELWLNPNSGRRAIFDMWISSDGENWTKVHDGQGDPGDPNKFETHTFAQPVTTKYIRYYAHGSNLSKWNGVKEIRFKLAQ